LKICQNVFDVGFEVKEKKINMSRLTCANKLLRTTDIAQATSKHQISIIIATVVHVRNNYTYCGACQKYNITLDTAENNYS